MKGFGFLTITFVLFACFVVIVSRLDLAGYYNPKSALGLW